MPSGFAVIRQWVSVQRDGAVVLDWGDGRAVDLIRGEFVVFSPSDFSHAVQDDELDTLKHMGIIYDYDDSNVYLTSMPEDPTHKNVES